MFMQKYAVVFIYLFTYRSPEGFSHSKVNFAVNNDFNTHRSLQTVTWLFEDSR